MSILILDNLTVNQIAAGEVVERPSSVVKELVENSLDAGARHVTAVLDVDEVTVQDDGSGMSAEDLRMAVERHATSKIRSSGDLWRLTTYGFRGEALPSIAAVSELDIRSRRAGDEIGRRLVVEGGRLVKEEPLAMPPGTVVSVRRLFYNTPVRARFLKNERTELGRCLAAVERLALARPDVSFKCSAGGRMSLHTPGTGSLRETVLAVFGLETARDVSEMQGPDQGGRSAVALVGGPATARSTRRRQGVWVNGRPVFVRGLLEAAETSYPLGVLPGRRHPLLFIFLLLPPSEVDANVHPTKAEVRLQRQDDVFSMVVGLIKGAGDPGAAPAQKHGPPVRASDVAAALDPGAPGQRLRRQISAGYPHPAGGSADTLRDEPSGWAEARPAALDGLRLLGQCGERWLACDGPGGLYLIDQHAAHERVLFEGLAKAAPGAAQPLAVPVPVDLAPSEYQTWLEHREALERLGLGTEAFGERTVLLREVPLAFSASPGGSGAAVPSHLLVDVVTELAGEKSASSALPAHLRVRRALASCLAAVKSRDRLAETEMTALTTALAACAEPWRCPHGRPAVVFLSHEELSRRFGR